KVLVGGHTAVPGEGFGIVQVAVHLLGRGDAVADIREIRPDALVAERGEAFVGVVAGLGLAGEIALLPFTAAPLDGRRSVGGTPSHTPKVRADVGGAHHLGVAVGAALGSVDLASVVARAVALQGPVGVGVHLAADLLALGVGRGDGLRLLKVG